MKHLRPLERLGDRYSSMLLLLAITLLVSLNGGLGRVDNLLYDLGQKLRTRPKPTDIVIVSIDEESLARLGRWPWSRHLHADLIDRLKQDGARVIGLDLVFAEPDTTDATSDQALASAIQRAGNVVLPVLLENSRVNGQMIETLPRPEFAANAAAMGRVHVELDEDGIARSIFLWEGVGTPAWPHFAHAVLQAAQALPPALAPRQQVPDHDLTGTSHPRPFILARQDERRINFLGPPGFVPSLSYAQVLEGEFMPGTFQGKIVLVGATAAGMGDRLPTPVSGLRQPMPGVEFHANVIEAMRSGTLVTRQPGWIVLIASILTSIAPLFWLPRLPPLPGLLASGLWFVGVAGSALLLPRVAGIWLPPSAALVAVALAYPIWSWRKLESAGRFLDQELARLQHDADWGDRPKGKSPTSASSDPLQSRIEQVQAASERLAALQNHRRETLAFISHDIRAPLASTLMQLDESHDASLARLREPIARSLRLAEDFLHTSRAEMADAASFSETDLTAVLHQAVDDAYLNARERSIALRRTIPEEPVWIQADFSLLHRALLNLLLNAIKYAPENSPVSLTLEIEDHAAIIRVSDQGPGIPIALQDRLFQRFSQAGHTHRPEGTGLGLYFVRTVVQKHAGSIDVESDQGIRTTFSIRLPINRPAEISSNAPSASTPR